MEVIDVPKVVYYDMDGVLVDFDKGWETAANPLKHDSGLLYRKFTRLLSATDFFYELEPTVYIKRLIETMKKFHAAGVQVKILTSVGQNWNDDHGTNTYRNKVRWLQKHITPHFNEYQFIGLPDFRMKQHFAEPTSLLIDDRYELVDSFIQAGGSALWYRNTPFSIVGVEEIVASLPRDNTHE